MNKKTVRQYFLCTIFSLIAFACTQKEEFLFTKVSSAKTGIRFSNQLQESDSANIIEYLYFYNGGGVAVGDFNNDQLADIYFISNQHSNALYLNKGDFSFKDITGSAGVAGKGNWKTGVTLVDINNDGYLDIYVSEVGKYKEFQGRNELFVNNGDLTFTEKAQEYGLDIIGFNTQAVFFDYDNDFDLDVFIVNHSVHSTEVFQDARIRNAYSEVSGDKLLRNNIDNGSLKFTEVTKSAGIYSSAVGYGLNAMAADINNDGWSDLYVSNDFHENDYYYLNNKDGTFKEINASAFSHESRFSMGSDIADMNNDGWLDIVTLDMLAPDRKTLYASAGDDPYDIFHAKYKLGYHYQYSRNCLQLNNGNGTRFSDIGLYAGMAATDWSWSPLAADFNNDGIKDLFISNGIIKRPNDLDFLKFNSTQFVGSGNTIDYRRLVGKMPKGEVSNYIFQGTDSIKFIDQTLSWGFNQPGATTGAAYTDLDNDGDLDIVCNNINDVASVYRNNTSQQSKNYFLDLNFHGKNSNKSAIGTKVKVWGSRGIQYAHLTATHGFESSALQYLHFGAGTDSVFARVEITWPDRQVQIVNNVATNQILDIQQDMVVTPKSNSKHDDSSMAFTNLTGMVNLPFVHKENEYIDFNDQPFIPHMLSTGGPKLAVADVNSDGLDDFFVCGARDQASALFQQTSSGKFIATNVELFEADARSEDINSIFFDADQDGDLDLLVVAGGNEKHVGDITAGDRLYLNDGKGKFFRSRQFPELPGDKSVVVASDIDHDGDQDLFIGGRAVPGQYGEIPASYLLLNGKGNFSVAQDNVVPGLQKVGMVTDASWFDVDQDGWTDLVIVGEWMPVTIFLNKKGRLINATRTYGLQQSTGWWTRLHIADVDSDGQSDLLIGNWGENSKLKASTSHPLLMYLLDYDDNGTVEQLLASWQDTAYYSFLGKEDLEKNIPLIKKKFLRYADFAGLTLQEVFGEKLAEAKKMEAAYLSTTVFLHKANRFVPAPVLPFQAQFAPVFGIVTDDFNHDGNVDVITGGNFSAVLPFEGSYQSSFGNVFWGNVNGKYIAPDIKLSSLNIQGEIRDIKKITLTHKRKALIISRNNQGLVFIGYE